ncbi:unnamed protein product, partial [Owenia fusiformis]
MPCDTHRVNNYGNQLLQLCKANNLFIANGRFGKCSELNTCVKGKGSVTDYAIASPRLLGNIDSVYIQDFSPDFSDVHCFLNLTVKSTSDNFNESDRDDITNEKNSCKFIWKQEEAQTFSQNLDFRKIDEITSLLQDEGSSVEGINVKLKECILDAAISWNLKKSFKVNHENNATEIKNKWFDNSCKNKRKIYNSAKNRYMRTRNMLDKEDMIRKNKQYKKQRIKAKCDYLKRLNSKLFDLKRSNSKQYWNILNPSRSKDELLKVSLDTMKEYYETLYKPQTSGNNMSENEIDKHYKDDFAHKLNLDILNSEIT